jgi:hypothetical protein
MLLRSLCALLFVVIGATASLAGFPTNRFHIRLDHGTPSRRGCLMLHDGRLIVWHNNGGRVGDTQNAPDRWYIDGTRIKCSTGGGYLAYDPTGKDSGVFIVAKPPEGIDWKVTLKRSEGGERGVLEAATGTVKGWTLDVEDPSSARPGPPSALSAAASRIIIAKEPRHPFVVERIYGHK